MNSMHLSDDQLDDYLIGDLAPEPAAHLSACEHCMARVAEAEAPMASFREMSLAWSERRSATLPTPVAQAARTSRRFGRVHWITGAAGLVTAALVIGIALPTHDAPATVASNAPTPSAKPAPVTPVPVVAPLPAPEIQTLAAISHTGMKSVTPVAATPEQISRDNEMLDAINRELDAPRDSDSLSLVAAARNGR